MGHACQLSFSPRILCLQEIPHPGPLDTAAAKRRQIAAQGASPGIGAREGGAPEGRKFTGRKSRGGERREAPHPFRVLCEKGGCVPPSQTKVLPLPHTPAMPRGLKRYYGAHDLHFITWQLFPPTPLLGTAAAATCSSTSGRSPATPPLCRARICRHARTLPSADQRTARDYAFDRDAGAETALCPPGIRRLRRRSARGRFSGPQVAGEIWQRRFYDFNVRTEHKRIEKLRYMHRNPVKRGLVAQPEQWAWSSFRSYALGEVGRCGSTTARY